MTLQEEHSNVVDILGAKALALSKKALSDIMKHASKPDSKKAGGLWETEEVWIKPSTMFVDLSYQRNPKERISTHKKILMEGYSLQRAQPFHVRVRPDGKVAILDGGGRWYIHTALLKLPDKEVRCLHYPNCRSIAQEAELFLGLNTPNRRRVNDTQKFNALVMRGDSLSVELKNLADVNGLVIGGSGKNGIPIAAAHFMQHMGADVFAEVAYIKRKAWSKYKPDSWAYMALAAMLQAAPSLKVGRLIGKMEKWAPVRLTAHVLGSSYGKPHASNMPPLIADALVDIYNTHLDKGDEPGSKKIKRLNPNWGESMIFAKKNHGVTVGVWAT